MNELATTLIGEGAAAPPAHILEAISDSLAHRNHSGAPHTTYAEVWHLAFWQQITLDWIAGVETPVPTHSAAGFPSEADTGRESWDQLHHRFLAGTEQAAAAAEDASRLEQSIRCPSPPGKPTRPMTVREQLESLAAHNTYHLGRVVLLRQLNNAWPPPSGGFTW
jgi:uncharacterized damage-inducible protein DinB